MGAYSIFHTEVRSVGWIYWDVAQAPYTRPKHYFSKNLIFFDNCHMLLLLSITSNDHLCILTLNQHINTFQMKISLSLWYCVQVLGLKLELLRRWLVIESTERHVCALGILIMKKTLPEVLKNIGREGLCSCMHGSCFTSEWWKW